MCRLDFAVYESYYNSTSYDLKFFALLYRTVLDF